VGDRARCRRRWLLARTAAGFGHQIAHLRHVLGDKTYESLAREDHRRDGDLRLRSNQPGSCRAQRCLLRALFETLDRGGDTAPRPERVFENRQVRASRLVMVVIMARWAMAWWWSALVS
jgi:hypothetical protein